MSCGPVVKIYFALTEQKSTSISIQILTCVFIILLNILWTRGWYYVTWYYITN